jgi:hypothetical protein
MSNWLDSKDVRILSSVGNPNKFNNKNKSETIAIYNDVMPGVDLSDQMKSERPIARNMVVKSYQKQMFFQILDMELINAYLILRSIKPRR